MFRIISMCCLLLLFKSTFANICDICDCQSAGNRVFSITCDCIATQDLHLTASVMMDVETTNMVILRNCQTISIERNSFALLDKLDTLGIQNCLRVNVAAGAFSKLNSLLINNVKHLSFNEMAFMGARGIKNIIINSANITELPRFSFYDVQGLDRFNLYNVHIERISSNSVNLSANSVGIEYSKVYKVDAEGFTVKALKVYFKESEFENQDPLSMNIQTKFQTRLLNNKFRGPFHMEILSPFVEFSGNHFENLNSSLLNSITLPRLMNNTILSADFQNMFQLFDHKDFHGNKFACACHNNLLNFTKHSSNYEILKINYCITKCNVSIFEYEVESVPNCMKNRVFDANSLCTFERSLRRLSTTTAPFESTEDILPGIHLQPRFLIEDKISNVESGSAQRTFSFIAVVVFLLVLRL